MKKLFSAALIFNLVVEWIAAAVLIGAPETLFPDGHPVGIDWARNYGFAALAIGTAALWVWPHRGDMKASGTILGILLTFHISISVAMAVAGNMLEALVLHSLMAVMFIYLYTQRAKWCTA